MLMRRTNTLGVAAAAMAALANAQENRPAVKAPSPPPAQTLSQPASNVPAGAPDVARSTFIQAMDADYRRRDLNGDGKVMRSEVEQYERTTTLAQAQASNRALFVSLDTDRNGTLTPGEFLAIAKAPNFIDVSPIMQRFDQNKDQIISIVEYRTATLANFDRLDLDKDGILSSSESKFIEQKNDIRGR